MKKLLRALAQGIVRTDLEALNAKLDRLTILVTQLLERESTIMKNIDDLVGDVQSATTLEQSMATALNGLSAQIAQLKSETTDPDTAAKIDSLAQQVENNVAAMTAAITANTQQPAQ